MKKGEYSKLLQTTEWADKRVKILERDKKTCKHCGKVGGTLHVHHLYYLSGNKPWEYPDTALLTLCPKCHEKEHFGKELSDFTKKKARAKGQIPSDKVHPKHHQQPKKNQSKKRHKAEPARKNTYEEVKAYLANPTPKKHKKPQVKPHSDKERAKKRVQEKMARGAWLMDTRRLHMERGTYPQRLPE